MNFFSCQFDTFSCFFATFTPTRDTKNLIGDMKKKHLDFFQKLFCQESVKDPPKVISTKVSGPYLDQEAKIDNFSPG